MKQTAKRRVSVLMSVLMLITSVIAAQPVLALTQSKSPVVRIAGGEMHSLALMEDGTVWAWGYNIYGQLGNGTMTDDIYMPAPVAGLTDIQDIAIGETNNLVLKKDGTVWVWGIATSDQYKGRAKSRPEQVAGLTGVKAISAGSSHYMALKQDGTVWTWGYNNLGQLGYGLTDSSVVYSTPEQVPGMTDVIAIAAGYTHSMALKQGGTVWTWGSNSYGKLGDGTETNRTIPEPVNYDINGSAFDGVTAIAAGRAHSMALKQDGTVWAWGNSEYKRINGGEVTPEQIVGLTDVKAVVAGHLFGMVLKQDGTVWTWGYNYHGKLGDGTTTNRYTPVQAIGLTSVKLIAAGPTHSMAIKQNGEVYAWGFNGYGQLGDGQTPKKTTPTPVESLSPLAAMTGLTVKSAASR